MMLKGKNFVLRKIKKSDFDSWVGNIIDPVISRNFVTNPRNLGEAKKEFSDKLKEKRKRKIESDDFAICINRKVVGEISLHLIIPNLSAKVDYWIGEDYRGKGIVTNALRLIVDYGFKKHRLRRVYAQTRTFNKASARVLEKAGFKLEGIKRKDVLKDGRYYDNFLYARVR